MTNEIIRKIAIKDYYGKFDDIADVWDGLKIDGKDFEEVIMHSYIVALN
ncbi:MAG: hypothetical protein ACSW8D_04855 [Prevotella sp.]